MQQCFSAGLNRRVMAKQNPARNDRLQGLKFLSEGNLYYFDTLSSLIRAALP